MPMHERWFRTFVTDVLGFVNVCYVGQVRDEGHIEVLKVPIEKYKYCEEVEKCRVLVCINEGKGCVEA